MTRKLGNICGGGQEGELSWGLGAQTLALRNVEDGGEVGGSRIRLGLRHVEDGGEVGGSGVGLGLLRAGGRSDSFCC